MNQKVAQPLIRREAHSLRPPISKNLCCLVTILGETAESRHNHGLDGSAKNAIGPNESRGDLEATSQIAKQGSFRANPDKL